MNEQVFYQVVHTKAKELGINPLLLISGIEGLYTFRNVAVSAINFDFLDSLILTIFALRIGDSFHSIAEENLMSSNDAQRQAAHLELRELSAEEIGNSKDPYLRSFATLLHGKSPVRKYHEKALEVAAHEVNKTQLSFGNGSIGAIVLDICSTDLKQHLGSILGDQ